MHNRNVERDLAAARAPQADIVGMSALLPTTVPHRTTVVDAFKAAGLDTGMLAAGGAPVSQMFCEEVGADGSAPDAASAVAIFKELAAARRLRKILTPAPDLACR